MSFVRNKTCELYSVWIILEGITEKILHSYVIVDAAAANDSSTLKL